MKNSEMEQTSLSHDSAGKKGSVALAAQPARASARMALSNGLGDYLKLPALHRAVDIVKAFDKPVRVVSHHDSDGLCSAAIIIKLLLRLNKRFHLTIMKNPEKKTIQTLHHHGLVIFTDIGLSFTTILAEMNDTSAIILDHHRTGEAGGGGDNILEISAGAFGLDGGRACCGSTLAFLFAVAVDERNWDLLPLAITGMIGDHQYINIMGLNKAIVETGKGKDAITMLENRLNICGVTLEDALLTSTEPFFKGVSGREEKITRYLDSIKWKKGTKLRYLSDEESNYLVNIFTTELLKHGTLPSTLGEQCVTKFYATMKIEGTKEEMDLRDFSRVIDFCGRAKDYPLGIALCLGDFSDHKKALEHRNSINETLLGSLLYLESGRVRKKKGIQYFTNPESSTSSPLSGIGMQYVFEQDKVTLVLSNSENETHVSARCLQEMIEEGLDLSTVMRESARAAGGQGGGHNIAAGASFPKENMKLFLETADRMVCEQLGR